VAKAPTGARAGTVPEDALTRRDGIHYFPLAALPLAGLALALVALALALEFRLIEFAYERLGIGPRAVVALLALALIGSRFNIPVASLRGEQVQDRFVTVFGVTYVVPTLEERDRTWIAVNVGGALVPTGLSLYLLATRARVWPALLVTGIVTLAVHALARPVRGVGIVVPALAAPLVAAGAALLLAREQPAIAAYVGGTLGTLIGADLLNLGRLRGLGAPVASIGGAGTFDGIFLTGILAVLLA
jgi:uncharacterized membrane protein